ncbi:MAG: hypothetical protein E7324_03930 [Clostridiales bacterium]|nr:hypothetical protein [Clostridiales bacterium]
MKKRKRPVSEILGIILFISLALSIVYSAVRFLMAPQIAPDGQEHIKVKSDYLLMLTQCTLGLIVMSLPSLLNKKWKLGIPHFIYVLYYLFLYCAVFLGEVFEFYYLVPHWDTILHFFSGAMLGALGFILVDILNRDARVRVQLSPLFLSLFAFCFALAAGAVWEIYEYACDTALGLNMQKYATEQGRELAGREALLDTMKDIIFDALAALGVSVMGYMTNIRRKKGRNQAENGTENVSIASGD